MHYKAGERAGLVLSSTYKIVGLTFDGHSYQPMDKLNLPQKVHFLAWLLINHWF